MMDENILRQKILSELWIIEGVERKFTTIKWSRLTFENTPIADVEWRKLPDEKLFDFFILLIKFHYLK